MAQEIGVDGRKTELPPMKDRQTMARRVRGYVTTSKSEVYGSSATSGRATSAERKVLATMGRRGEKKAAERWKDPDSDYARAEREKLAKANQLRALKGKGTRGKVLSVIIDIFTQTGHEPSEREIGAELGITRQQANRHLKALRDAGLL